MPEDLAGQSLQWTIERRISYPSIEDVVPSPDGTRVAYVVREPLLTDERSEFIHQIYLAAPGDEPVQLTFGEHRGFCPRWSPDGRFIAFISNRTGHANVYVLRVDGGEAWALTKDEKTDVSSLKWSPDGTRIAFLMTEPPTDEKEKAAKAKDDARQWEVDVDFTHLFTVPFAIGPRQLPQATQVTRGRSQVTGYDWFPDGLRFAVTHRPSPLADTWPETRLATVAADGRSLDLTDVAPVATDGTGPFVSSDGRWIACPTGELPAHWGGAGRIVMYPVNGGAPRPLAATPDGETFPIGWAADNQSFYVHDLSGTTAQFFALPIDGGPAHPLTDTTQLKTWASVNRQDQITYVGQDFDQPNAVFLLDVRTGETRLVAQPSLPVDWPEAPLPTAEVIRWQAPDGRPIEGILVYPQNYASGQRCPLIVAVHGGPAGVFQRTYLGDPAGYADVAGLAERGYAVLRANPRGSGGYGKEFRFANYGNWGEGDFHDIMSGVDHLIDRGIVDPERLGIMGWSYGGFMTSWAITQTHRFKAACVGAGVTNLVSFNGTADIPSFVPDYFSSEFWDDLETYRRHSPVLNAKGIQTPTLVQHGDQDVRVPLSQGREFYNALRRQGVPVDMVIYPRQGHLVNEPRLIIDIRRRANAWLDRWILGKT